MLSDTTTQHLLSATMYVNDAKSNPNYQYPFVINPDICTRFQFKEPAELLDRCIAKVRPANHYRYGPVFDTLRRDMGRGLFLPAGNTLAATSEAQPLLIPNCSIFAAGDEAFFRSQRAVIEKTWDDGTGIGFDLNECADPVAMLRELVEWTEHSGFKYRFKRGNLASIHWRHPKLAEFITAKDNNPQAIGIFNISVCLDGALFESPRCDEVLGLIATSAHKSGDPGVIFTDTTNKYPKHLERYGPEVRCLYALNKPMTTLVPCGEQAMFEYETCNLGSINLAAPDLYTNGTAVTTFAEWHAAIDWDVFRRVVRSAVVFLDSAIDVMSFSDDRFKAQTLKFRRIGLGVSGFGDMLMLLGGIRYGSPLSIAISKHLSAFVSATAREQSEELQREKIADEGYMPTMGHPDLRNVSITCLPPTGGITGLWGLRCFSIEPKFTHGYETTVTIDEHLAVVAAWQSSMENSISKTVNCRGSTTPEEIADGIRMAYALGIKSVTFFRDGCRPDAPHNTGAAPAVATTVAVTVEAGASDAAECADCAHPLRGGYQLDFSANEDMGLTPQFGPVAQSPALSPANTDDRMTRIALE